MTFKELICKGLHDEIIEIINNQRSERKIQRWIKMKLRFTKKTVNTCFIGRRTKYDLRSS